MKAKMHLTDSEIAEEINSYVFLSGTGETI
jgi:hypothetical protein